MRPATIGKAVALGAMSGMRSMAGPAVLAINAEEQTPLTRAVPVMAIGEMIADKTPFIGNRIDPLPLAGRAFMGAIVGGLIAREEDASVVLGGLIGAATAVVVAHLAYRARVYAQDRVGASAGFIEDGVVVGMGSLSMLWSRAR
jgi:uncharacterized membrane protein